MSQRATQTAKYWVEDFRLDDSDIEHLYNVLLEKETPLSADEMALVLVRFRVQREEVTLQTRGPAGRYYRPADKHRVGDEIVLTALGNALGKVIGTRPGNNPDYGTYTVLEVALDDGQRLELASELQGDHPLNMVQDEVAEETDSLLSPEELFINYGGYVADAIEEALEEHSDLVRLAGRWFPRSLLVPITIGHLNLAEAVLDMAGGGPLSTAEIIEQIGMLDDINPRLAEFSLNYGLQEDDRFDEVGMSGQVMWFLKRMEPPGVLQAPPWLHYEPVPYDPSRLPPDLQDVEAEIGDEHSQLRRKRGPVPDAVTVTLTYPHIRAGTLPLSPQLRRMFPTAYESPRVYFTLVDAESGEEMPGWVVRSFGYVYGLENWFSKQDIPIGGYLTINRTDKTGHVKISYAQRRNPRIEWVRTAVVDGDRIRYENRSRPIGCDYDDQLIIDVEDPDAVDQLARRPAMRKLSLDQIIEMTMRELAALTPQGSVHGKTIYSAVNVLRRCPPGLIFTRMLAMPQFESIGGGYWQVTE
ncbi:MAG: hypothetical protein Kow00124_04870 [Anaerolineae bacterium]